MILIDIMIAENYMQFAGKEKVIFLVNVTVFSWFRLPRLYESSS